MTTDTALTILPTVEGCAPGIVSRDPLTVQCGECGVTAARTTERTDAAFLILSGFHFHNHPAPDRIRRCPDCLARVRAACPRCRR